MGASPQTPNINLVLLWNQYAKHCPSRKSLKAKNYPCGGIYICKDVPAEEAFPPALDTHRSTWPWGLMGKLHLHLSQWPWPFLGVITDLMKLKAFPACFIVSKHPFKYCKAGILYRLNGSRLCRMNQMNFLNFLTVLFSSQYKWITWLYLYFQCILMVYQWKKYCLLIHNVIFRHKLMHVCSDAMAGVKEPQALVLAYINDGGLR